MSPEYMTTLSFARGFPPPGLKNVRRLLNSCLSCSGGFGRARACGSGGIGGGPTAGAPSVPPGDPGRPRVGSLVPPNGLASSGLPPNVAGAELGSSMGRPPGVPSSGALGAGGALGRLCRRSEISICLSHENTERKPMSYLDILDPNTGQIAAKYPQ